MADLTVTEKAHRFDIEKQKKGIAKLKGKVQMLRVIEFGVLSFTSLGLGVMKAWKPEWVSSFSGYGEAIIDGTTALVGGVIWAVSPDSKSGQVPMEIGGGMLGAGLGSLFQFGGQKLYNAIAA